jgi:type II secretory pathway pseudopilin PulG
MKKSKQKNRAFTLVELLLYISISSIIILVTSGYLSIFLETQVKNETVREVEQQGAFAMYSITQALSNAESITSPVIGTNQTTLSIQTFSPANNPTVFSVDAGTLQIKEGSANAVALHNPRIQISNLLFKNLSRTGTAGIIQVSFLVTYLNNSGRYEYSFEKQFISSAALHQP